MRPTRAVAAVVSRSVERFERAIMNATLQSPGSELSPLLIRNFIPRSTVA
jgi:hypothetical protein